MLPPLSSVELRMIAHFRNPYLSSQDSDSSWAPGMHWYRDVSSEAESAEDDQMT